jgi:hypothetical protein
LPKPPPFSRIDKTFKGGKMKAFITTFLFIPALVFAQNIDVKDIDTESENTTIEISKGKKKTNSEALWEVAEGSAEITGEATIMAKEANQSWKKACDEWKKEFRADNKENKIISMSCGKPDCTSDAAGKVCSSKANYKIKTKLN